MAIVKESRDRWRSDAGDLARALDAASFVLIHGDRPQQLTAGHTARELLHAKGYPVRESRPLVFRVTARTATGYQSWIALSPSSTDVLIDTLQYFHGAPVTITVRPGDPA